MILSEETIQSWKQLVMEASASGLSMNAWCEKNHICFNTLRYRKKVLIERGEICPDETRVQRRSSEEWRKLIAEFSVSGLSITAWCKEHHISRSTLRFWRKVFIEHTEIAPDLRKNQRHHQREEWWKERILEADASGLDMKGWCRQNHVCLASFRSWKKALIERGEISPNVCKNQKNDKKDYWKKIILEASASGLSITVWCEQHHVRCGSFFQWRAKLIKGGEITPDICRDLNRKRAREEHWKKLLLEADASGMPLYAWSAEHHIHDTILRYWKRKLIECGEVRSDICKNHRHRTDLWRKRILEGAASGLSVTAWCKEHKISRTSLREWMDKLIAQGEISPEIWKSHRKSKGEERTHLIPSTSPVFCELPQFGRTEERENVTLIRNGAKFKVGKFCLSVEEDIPEETFNIAAEMLSTITEVLGNA